MLPSEEEFKQNVINSWNNKADEYNQWSELDSDEKVDYVIEIMIEIIKKKKIKESNFSVKYGWDV